MSVEAQISKVALLDLIEMVPPLIGFNEARNDVAGHVQEDFWVHLLPTHEVLHVWETRAARQRQRGRYVADIELLLQRISELQPEHVGLVVVIAEPFGNAIFVSPDLSHALSIVRRRGRRDHTRADSEDAKGAFD